MFVSDPRSHRPAVHRPGAFVRSQTLADAARTMAGEGIKSIVVSDEDGRPEGILTSTDFVRMAAADRSPSAVTVDEYVTSETVTTPVE